MRAVMMADIIQSRKIKDRELVQHELIKLLDILNRVFGERLVRNVEIQGGDSVQGIFIKPSDAFLFLRMLQMVMSPIKLRGSIGVGTLAYEDPLFSSNQMDGPAFHNAREAMDSLGNTKRQAIVFNSSYENKYRNSEINTYLKMYDQVRDGSSEKLFHVSMINEILDPISMNDKLNFGSKESNLQDLIDISSSIRENALESNDEASVSKSFFEYNLEILKIPQYSSIIKKDKRRNITQNMLSNKKLSYSSNDFVQRGIQEHIGEILNTKRQNIQRYFSTRVKDERLYTAIICRMMDDN